MVFHWTLLEMQWGCAARSTAHPTSTSRYPVDLGSVNPVAMVLVACLLDRCLGAGDFDGENVGRAKHVGAEDHMLPVGRETDIWLKFIVVLRHVDEALGAENAGMDEFVADGV